MEKDIQTALSCRGLGWDDGNSYGGCVPASPGCAWPASLHAGAAPNIFWERGSAAYGTTAGWCQEDI